MQRIAYLMTSFPVLSETFIGNEIRAMQAKGHFILPCSFERASGKAQPADLMLADQLKLLIDVPVAKVLWQLSASPKRLQSAMQFINQQKSLPARSLLWYGARMAALVEQHGCQHIHAHFGLASAATAIVAAKLAGVTVSFTCHGFDVYRSPADLAVKMKHADFTVAVCNEMQNILRQQAPEANIRMIRCGVDEQQFTSDEFNPFNQKRLLYLGRLSETKGIDVLLHALANIPVRERPVLDIVGDGPLYLPLLKKMIRLDLMGYVHFLGPRSSTWLYNNHNRYTAMCCPYVITDQGVRDTGPLVLKEAMALRLPLITTDLPACQEMLCDSSGKMQPLGYMVPMQDKMSLAGAIRLLLKQSPQTLRIMGKNGRAHYLQHFTTAKQAEALSVAIESCQKEVRHAVLQE
ncbi:glycosyltransferase family 4 protein [Oceanospirillum sediminis]|uniref:Glycosyltransferase family 4 protein n=1 Tax=Oceanospirillum sediminis TaxID=2760088 RepID=A0A839IUG9_9GAMM|nr:glycosyltransferase family 4 protein [Oceanospirillum sediminis]MBB1489093.1 glycosyltransferase family 4 protein [Oceanospirillum sediminis]